MITDIQVRKLKKYLSQGKTLEIAASKAGMGEKSGRKYRDLDKLPSEIIAERIRYWRTREDPFEEIWEEVVPFLARLSLFAVPTARNYLNFRHRPQKVGTTWSFSVQLLQIQSEGVVALAGSI